MLRLISHNNGKDDAMITREKRKWFSPGACLGDKRGFTLIEMIVTVILLGVIASFAGVSMIKGIQGFFYTRENTVLAQKAQPALNRIALELRYLNALTTANAHEITFGSSKRNSGDRVTIRLNNNAAEVIDDRISASAFTLMDDVGDLTFTYIIADGTQSGTPQATFNVSNDLSTLQAITVELTAAGVFGDIMFETTINPRNNGLSNGPVPQ